MIGLPAFLIAELGSTTTIFDTRWGDFTPSEDVLGLLYLVNGILCLFVFEAIRRERVVSVAVPLRRVTVLGLTLSIPALILHHEVEYMQEHLAIPNWAWLVIGAAALYLISRLHEHATRVTDRYFSRDLDRIEKRVGAAILKARDRNEVDRLLSEEPFRALKLTSAASFRARRQLLPAERPVSGLGPRPPRRRLPRIRRYGRARRGKALRRRRRAATAMSRNCPRVSPARSWPCLPPIPFAALP